MHPENDLGGCFDLISIAGLDTLEKYDWTLSFYPSGRHPKPRCLTTATSQDTIGP